MTNPEGSLTVRLREIMDEFISCIDGDWKLPNRAIDRCVDAILTAVQEREREALRWIHTADAELEPIVQDAGVDVLEHVKAAQGALEDALLALKTGEPPEAA